MATRTEKKASRIAKRVGQGSRAAAGATRRLSKVMDRVAAASEKLSKPRKLSKTRKVLTSAAKAVAVGAVTMGMRRVAKLAEDKADAIEAGAKRRSRLKTAAKVAGAAAAVAGAVVLARRARNK